MGHAPPEQHVQERGQAPGHGKAQEAMHASVAAKSQPATAHRGEPPRYLADEVKGLIGQALHLALAPLRIARAFVRGLFSPTDATTA